MASDGPGVAVIGSGYVGTVVAACLAWVGYVVVGVEPDPAKLRMLQSGRAPFHEQDLDTYLAAGQRSGRLRFTAAMADALAEAEVVFVCVGAPSSPDGTTDRRPIEAVADDLAWALTDQVVVVKTTLPIGSNRWLTRRLAEARPRGRPVSVVSNPEFLRESTAVADFLHPERVVLGGDDPSAIEAAAAVYRPILDQTFRGGDRKARPALVCTDPATAEAVKYAANAFLATKISFINEVANICEVTGADVIQVATTIGLDRRIGGGFLNAGLGWGGSCLGKDMAVLRNTAGHAGYDAALLREVVKVNDRQRQLVVTKLEAQLGSLAGRRVCVFGLAFKPGTDDLRDAPALDVIARLSAAGAEVTACDPVVGAVPGHPAVTVSPDPYVAAAGADAVVLATEWPELLEVDPEALRSVMRQAVFIDARNAVDLAAYSAAGFACEGFGRTLDGLWPPGGEIDLSGLEAEISRLRPA